jgi:hypothetical protein
VSGKEILMHAVFWAKVETFVSTFFTFEKIVYDIIYALIRPTEKGGEGVIRGWRLVAHEL